MRPPPKSLSGEATREPIWFLDQNAGPAKRDFRNAPNGNVLSKLSTENTYPFEYVHKIIPVVGPP